MRIAQLSDFHYTRPTKNLFKLFSKRIVGFLNWTFSRKKTFSEEILESIPPLLKELNVDCILLGGDLTTTALPEEFEAAAQWVAKLPAPWLALPGNHDYYTASSERSKRFFRYFSNRETKLRLANDRIEVHQLKEGVWLIALDVARATNWVSSRGLFSEKLEESFKNTLAQIPAGDSIFVWTHYPFFQHEGPRRILKRGEALRKILESDRRIRLFLHGHTHRNTVANLQASGLPAILDSGSCAQLDRASWNLIDLEETGCRIGVYRWADGWKLDKQEAFTWTRI